MGGLIAVTVFNASWLQTLYFVTGVAQLHSFSRCLESCRGCPALSSEPEGSRDTGRRFTNIGPKPAREAGIPFCTAQPSSPGGWRSRSCTRLMTP